MIPICLALAVAASAGETLEHAGEHADGFRLIHADELARTLAAKTPAVHLYDANHQAFREEEGVIAGATLLVNAHEYDIAAVLPADKSAPLVFYCSSRL